MSKCFPNGFDSWQETHYEIVSELSHLESECTTFKYPIIDKIYESQGRGGLYDLAKQWTDEFEELYKNKDWDGDFFDTIDEFLNKKYNENS